MALGAINLPHVTQTLEQLEQPSVYLTQRGRRLQRRRLHRTGHV
jgi:hypothetical protein